jgi:hypothetical protein
MLMTTVTLSNSTCKGRRDWSSAQDALSHDYSSNVEGVARLLLLLLLLLLCRLCCVDGVWAHTHTAA